MKKQFQCFRDEIEHLRRGQERANYTSFMTLSQDFETLLDHYNMVKTMNKKLKYELMQSGTREKQFLSLLKKTQEYGKEAEELESEFEGILDRIEAEYSLRRAENKFVEIKGKHDQSVRIPRLDLGIIRYHQAKQ